MKLFKTPYVYGLTLVAAIAAAFVFLSSSNNEIKIPTWSTTQCYKQNPEIEKTLRLISGEQPKNFIAMNDLIMHLVSQAKSNQSDELVEEIFSLIESSKKILTSATDNKAPYMAEAQMLSYQHRFQEAADKLLILLKANVSDSAVLRALVWNALAKKDIETTYKYLPEISLKPDIETYLLYAKLMFLKSNREEFKFYIKKIFAVESNQTCFESLEARMLLARYGLETMNSSLVRAALKSVALINGDDPRIYLLSARLESDNGHYNDAIEALEASMKKQPLPKYLTEMAKIEILRGHQTEAQSYLSQSILVLEDSLKKNAGHRLELAEALILKNTKISLNQAVGLLAEELALRNTIEVYYWMSVARALQKDSIYGLKVLQPFLDQEFSTALPALFKLLKDRENLSNGFSNRQLSMPLPAELLLLSQSKAN